MQTSVAKPAASCRRQFVALVLCLLSPATFAATNYTVAGWNNLGMHCMDSDYSVFSVLPPYNTICAQLIQGVNGTASILSNGIAISYQAAADIDGSVNTTSAGKGNWYNFMGSPGIIGVTLPVDVGLPVPGPGTYNMPGASNVAQPMGFETPWNWFVAYGIPIFPTDDAGRPNQYPMMRLVASNSVNQILATTDIVLPVSDEMNCRLCHLSGSGPAAKPAAGWVNDSNPGRDYRLNILRLHDERQWASNASLYSQALAANSFNPAGLYATVVVDKHPFICAKCHLSEALPFPELLGIPQLTTSVHGHHASVIDPRNNQTLDAASNRTSCYTCHPGSVTRCLRGAMGKAVNPVDGTMAMQCQSCHGNMSAVGDPGRTGWFQEPNCQNCHSGNAINNTGQIRFTSAFTNGVPRTPATNQFATTPDTPLGGTSLYRFSAGHGGVKCSGCHGSTHAEFPSAFPNDNLTSVIHQGHAGMLVECNVCHGAQPNTIDHGPHGMHPIGTSSPGNWADSHNDIMESSSYSRSKCRVCHGANYEGTVLSRVQADRTVSAGKFGSRTFWRGEQISCYQCHNGPDTSDTTSKGFPTANNASATTAAGVSVAIPLTASTSNLRIVSEPSHGTVSLSGTTATYYPETGFSGGDRFTFAASNGFNDSPLATVSVQVNALDSNSNGIPDWWETLNFGSLTNATTDTDGDSLSNLQEYLAGTDPKDARSSLRLFGFGPNGQDLTLSFTSLLSQKYTLESATDLVAGNWSYLKTVWGRTDAASATDFGALNQSRKFYRVRTAPIPVAYDDALDAAYAGGFPNTSDGGKGFDGWQLSPSSSSSTAGFFIGDSNNNGCVPEGYGTGPGIDLSGTAFGIYANSGAQADAARHFTAGSMALGQTFSIDFDNGCLSGTGTKAGFALRNASSENRFEFFFNAGDSVYRLHDGSGASVSTGVGFTQRGLHVNFTLTGPDTYTVIITRLIDGSFTTMTGTLAGTAGTGVDRVDLYYFNSSTGGNTRDLFFDRLELY